MYLSEYNACKFSPSSSECHIFDELLHISFFACQLHGAHDTWNTNPTSVSLEAFGYRLHVSSSTYFPLQTRVLEKKHRLQCAPPCSLANTTGSCFPSEGLHFAPRKSVATHFVYSMSCACTSDTLGGVHHASTQRM